MAIGNEAKRRQLELDERAVQRWENEGGRCAQRPEPMRRRVVQPAASHADPKPDVIAP